MTAFIIDAYGRLLCVWQVPRAALQADFALDALEAALWQLRGDLDGLIHHFDCGSQYFAIRCVERPAGAGVELLGGSHGHGPRKGIDEGEYITLEWLDSVNHCCLLDPIGDILAAEYEAAY
jgi:putative transposase